MADTSGPCSDCGVMYDKGAVDDCPVCELRDAIDRLDDEVTDAQADLDAALSRMPQGDNDDEDDGFEGESHD